MQNDIRSIAAELGELVARKNQAYGDSISAVGIILQDMLDGYFDSESLTYRIPISLLDHLAAIVRVLDKLNRIVANPDGDLMQESPWLDIAGYALLMVKHDRDAKSERKGN